MREIEKLFANGEVAMEELANGELIERAEFVKKGISACKKTIMFPLGKNKVDCYFYTDCTGEYEAWGSCTNDGMFTCFSNWGGEHLAGKCNLMSFNDIYMALKHSEFACNLRRFLRCQIEKAN